MLSGADLLEVELQRAVAIDPPRLDLLALAVARLDDAPSDDDAVLTTLDDWGTRVRDAIGRPRPDGPEALAVVLAGELDLRGDDERYDDPENSFLPRVIARRRGLPILLSIVYLEVARRADIPLVGLALPGHFVVGHPTPRGELVVLDPFAGGRVMGRAELDALVARAAAAMRPAMLEPASPHTIATRMLRNLVGSYQRLARRDDVRAAASLLRALEPDDATARVALADSPGTPEDHLN